MEQDKQLTLFDKIEPEVSSEENKLSLLALDEIPSVGFATVRSLYDAFNGNITQVWDADKDNLITQLQRARIPQPNLVVERIQAHSKQSLDIAKERLLLLKRRKISIIFRGTKLYPKSLLSLKSPPAWLFVEGNVEVLSDQSIVAVVGTREPTKKGVEAAKWLSTLLVTRGCVILSGLAEGIDEAGHRAAVDYGAPTIAVLGHGIDVVFPAATSDLRRQLIEFGGAVISEYLPRDHYSSERFVQRNRLQASLAKLVAVVEGKAKSGTAHTVRFSRELQRPLFGVRIGPPMAIPQQELLGDLQKHNEPVFTLDHYQEREQLSKYLSIQLPIQLREQRIGTYRLFSRLLKEVDRLAHDYPVKDSDFEWLVSQIYKYRDGIWRKKENDHQSDHS